MEEHARKAAASPASRSRTEAVKPERRANGSGEIGRAHRHPRVRKDFFDAVCEGTEPFCDGTEAIHASMDAICEGMETIHASMEPFCEGRETIHASMDAVCEGMETVRASKEAFCEGMDTVHASKDAICEGNGARRAVVCCTGFPRARE